MKFENTEVWGFEHALRGMRNPLESWDKSDSGCKLYCSVEGVCVEKPCSYDGCSGCTTTKYMIGKNDLELMRKLIKAGSEHRKFLRQIFVAVDITAPLFWWKEFDTYKVGTVASSTSTMHKLASTPITLECFEMNDFSSNVEIEDGKDDNYTHYSITEVWSYLIDKCEFLRQKYNKIIENKKYLEEIKEFEEAEKAQVMAKKYWKELIRLLPESWLQKRTITMNYENILNMYRQRKNHKLTEWSKSFCNWVKTLPYAEELICIGD